MNVVSLPKRIGCIIISIVTNFIMFSSCLVGDLSVAFTAMFITVPTYSAMMLIYPTYLYAVFPVITAVSIYLVTDNILITLLGIMFLLLSALCADGVLKKRTKYDTIVRMSVVMFFAAIFMFVLLVFITQDHFSREAILELCDELLQEFNESVESLGGEVEEFSILFEELAKTIPACLLMSFAALSYFSCTLARKIVYWFDLNNRVFNFDNLWEFEMPLETAYLYIFSYAFLFVSPLLNLDFPAFEVMIYIIIYPLMFGMIVSGIKQIKEWLKQKEFGKGLIVFLIIIGLFVFLYLVLSATAFIGVYRCFNVNKPKKWTVEK